MTTLDSTALTYFIYIVETMSRAAKAKSGKQSLQLSKSARLKMMLTGRKLDPHYVTMDKLENYSQEEISDIYNSILN